MIKANQDLGPGLERAIQYVPDLWGSWKVHLGTYRLREKWRKSGWVSQVWDKSG